MLPVVAGRRHVDVRRRRGEAGGQRAEVVRGGDADHAVLERAQDARHERNADAVAELDPLEPERRHLLQHRIPIGMPLRQPAGRK